MCDYLFLIVDLCQNPLTVSFHVFPLGLGKAVYSREWPSFFQQKQPKLERAKQIPEWETYDQEVDSFARRLVRRDNVNADVVVVGSAEVLEDSIKAPNDHRQDHEQSEEQVDPRSPGPRAHEEL